jgi:hypothetical protein
MQLTARLVRATGRKRPRRHVFAQGVLTLVAVDSCRRSEHNGSGRARPGAARGIENVDRAGQIDAVRLEPVSMTLDHRGNRGEMEAAVYVLDGAPQHNRIGDVSFDELDPAGQVFAFAMRKIVEHAHHVAARDQRFGKVRADEARASSDEEKPARGRRVAATERLGQGKAVEHSPLSRPVCAAWLIARSAKRDFVAFSSNACDIELWLIREFFSRVNRVPARRAIRTRLRRR